MTTQLSRALQLAYIDYVHNLKKNSPVLNTSTLSYCLWPRTRNCGNVKSLLNSTA